MSWSPKLFDLTPQHLFSYQNKNIYLCHWLRFVGNRMSGWLLWLCDINRLPLFNLFIKIRFYYCKPKLYKTTPKHKIAVNRLARTYSRFIMHFVNCIVISLLSTKDNLFEVLIAWCYLITDNLRRNYLYLLLIQKTLLPSSFGCF